MLFLAQASSGRNKAFARQALFDKESKYMSQTLGSHLFFCSLFSFIFQAKQPPSQPASRYWSGQVGTRAIRKGIESTSSTSSWLKRKKKKREQAVTWCCDSYRLLWLATSDFWTFTLLWNCSQSLESQYPRVQFACHRMQLWDTEEKQVVTPLLIWLFSC